jgi:hypothetical protein
MNHKVLIINDLFEIFSGKDISPSAFGFRGGPVAAGQHACPQGSSVFGFRAPPILATRCRKSFWQKLFTKLLTKLFPPCSAEAMTETGTERALPSGEGQVSPRRDWCISERGISPRRDRWVPVPGYSAGAEQAVFEVDDSTGGGMSGLEGQVGGTGDLGKRCRKLLPNIFAQRYRARLMVTMGSPFFEGFRSVSNGVHGYYGLEGQVI